MNILLRRKKFKRTDIWREGKWLDLWSVVHLLSGILVGFFFFLLHIPPLAGVLFAVFALTVYELFEVAVEIYEAPTNRFMDVVVGMVGYVPVYFYVSPLLTRENIVLTFSIILLVNIVMSVHGWHASHKASVLEKRVRANIKKNREKIKERGIKFRARHTNKS